MYREKGFSLIELLIVVVIMGIIAAIAIPNLLSSRRSANEASAISSLRTYHGAQMTYAATYGNSNYAGATAPDAFSMLATINLLDSTLGSGSKNGYDFLGGSLPRSTASLATFVGAAQPSATSGVTQTGARVFMVSTDGAIFYDDIALSNGLTVNTVNGALVLSGGIPIPR